MHNFTTHRHSVTLYKFPLLSQQAALLPPHSFVATQKGGFHLVIGGHVFRSKSKNGDCAYWKCCKAEERKCGASAKTFVATHELCQLRDDHNHPPDEAYIQASVARWS
jgi:hypothetical protein